MSEALIIVFAVLAVYGTLRLLITYERRHGPAEFEPSQERLP